MSLDAPTPFIPAVDDGWAILSEPPGARDLAVPDHWRHSLDRSRRRRTARRSPRGGLRVGAAVAALAATGVATAAVGAPEAVAAKRSASTLERGDRGAAVVTLQRRLGVSADGVFGPRTERAVKRFQRRNGLAADGIVGPLTSAALDLGRAPRAKAPRAKAKAPRAKAAPAPSAPSSKAAAAAARYALAKSGAPYAYGGDGPGSFDCSGLTSYAFRRAGISLPRTSFAQFGVGTPVRRSRIRTGDLVFFDTAGAGASHVGVATGTDTVVSATSRGVMEHAISDSYWGSHYVGARRVRGN